ncbi:hypothetical protein L1887_05160 [Cichorium endivia]|nr:hypothetical protein L1887_05160 [Cichorium endivia]
MPARNVVTWNSMMVPCSQNQMHEEAIHVFHDMRTEGIQPTIITMVTYGDGCAYFKSYFGHNDRRKKPDNDFEKLIWVLKVILGSVDMYGNFGALEDARKMFDNIPARNVVTWNSMMVPFARILNLTLVVPELDKTSLWADPSDFEDIFDVRYFIESLRDEVRIVKRLPKRFSRKYGFQPLEMPPVSWLTEKYYFEQLGTKLSAHVFFV